MSGLQQKALLLQALQYVKQFKGKSILIKMGGSILDEPKLVRNLCQDLKLLRAAGIAIVIVHGGSKAIESALSTYNLSWQFHQGQRVTTPEMMEVIEMVLSGQVNKMLVKNLNALGVPAVGLSGVDQQLLCCGLASEALGLVGEVEQVNVDLLKSFVDMQQQNADGGFIPVVSPVGVMKDGQAVNVNADWAACCIAAELGVEKMIYLTDQDGIYQGGQLVSECNTAKLQSLVDAGVVVGGMMTKVNTILKALQKGVEHIHILGAKKEHVLLEEIFTEAGVGTLCTV